MGLTEIFPKESTSFQSPSYTTHLQANAHSLRYIKLLSCAVGVLAALCIAIIGVLTWHMTQSVLCRDLDRVITITVQKAMQIEHNHAAMKYLVNTSVEIIKAFESHEALIRSLQTNMQRERRKVQAKFNDQENVIERNADKIAKANETITLIGTEDIKTLKTDVVGFADDLIQKKSEAFVNTLHKLQEDVDVHTDNITSLKQNLKTCLDEMEILQEKLEKHKVDLDELKAQYVNQTQTADVKPWDCEDVSTTNKSSKSGLFRMYPTSFSTSGLSVYCDMVTQGGGWIVIQRRQDGREDFYRGWMEYKKGFGNLTSEFWLGLDNIHALVSDGNWKLLINMRNDRLVQKYAMYKTFFVGPENSSYILTIGNYSGDAGDSLKLHNGMKFSTKDKDNDNSSDRVCAVMYTGAWWYNKCLTSNLNGVYGSTGSKGPGWATFGDGAPLAWVEMRMKKKM